MSATGATRPTSAYDEPRADHRSDGRPHTARRLVTETKASFKTTEFFSFIAVLIGILIAVLVAALVYAICVALGLPSIVGIVAAILVLLAGIPTGGYGFGDRFGHRRV